MKAKIIKLFIYYLSIVSLSLLAESNAVFNKITNENRSVYSISFFDQYTPQNAMDIINRLPGFSFDEGEQSRGFGGNAGNVLINGTRPTSKSGGIKEALERIPASQVLQIEILRSGAGTGEAAGQTVVANVVKQDIKKSGTWGVKFVRAPNGVFKPQVETAITQKLGKWDTLIDVEIAADPEYRTIYTENFNANNVLTTTANETLTSLDKDISMNGEGSRKLGGGILSINGALSGSNWRSELATDTFLSLSNANSTSDEIGSLEEKEKNIHAELGIDWVKHFDAWKLRLIALTALNDREFENYFKLVNQALNELESSEYTLNKLKTEHIARITLGKIGDSTFKSEFGAEIANNKLDTALTLVENGVVQTLEGVDLVKEIRGEIFANFVYLLNQDLTIEAGLTAETSEIKAYSESINNQKFNFIKPRVSVNYNFTKNSILSLVLERTVDQLDFSDFAASSDITEQRTISGNNNLKPEHATVFSAIYDWRFSERGSINIEAVYEFRKDIQEQIFLPSGNEGLGNAGDAELWYIKTNLSFPIDKLLKNGLFEVYYAYKGSEFYDPIINNNRVIYNYIPHYLKVDFRQDTPAYDISWGLQYKNHFSKKRFYVDEVQTNEGNDRISRLFIETTRFFNIKTRLEIKDSNVALFTQSRYFYHGDRSGQFDGLEVEKLKRSSEVNLSFTGTF